MSWNLKQYHTTEENEDLKRCERPARLTD